MKLDKKSLQLLLEGVHSREPIAGLTHPFYRYPACFSPRFARAAIQVFTDRGDLVMDPFMGGGTTIVEAQALGRAAIGLDISSLSCFITKAKTTLLSDSDIQSVIIWLERTIRSVNIRRRVTRARHWIENGYHRNLNTSRTWPIRKSVELAIARIPQLRSRPRQTFARALLLRTAQWALDCRSDVPSVAQFRQRMTAFLDEMIAGAQEYREAVARAYPSRSSIDTRNRLVILNRSADGLDREPKITAYGPPKLVLTSPPYPGVHVMYHRWQVLGRRETPAPFWITNTRSILV